MGRGLADVEEDNERLRDQIRELEIQVDDQINEIRELKAELNGRCRSCEAPS